MSMIAKLEVAAMRDFGSGQLIEMRCVCENDLMAAYAGSEEDRLFTKYSPWGEARVHTADSPTFGKIMVGDKFYVLMARGDELADENPMPGALMTVRARVAGITNHGSGMTETVDIANALPDKTSVITAFSWRMNVDNPAATGQLIPGRDDYRVGFFPASTFDRDGAIAAAHAAR